MKPNTSMDDFDAAGELPPSSASESPQPRRAHEPRQLVRSRRQLSDDELDRVINYERDPHLRNGETGMELRAQQFHYPFDGQDESLVGLSEELIAARDPFSDRAEEFRALRKELLASVFAGSEKPALAVVSAEQGEGKSYTVANLAVSFSQFAGRTLLIDANLRQPALHRLLGAPNKVGLRNLLAGDVQREAVVRVNGVEGLHLLGAGPAVAEPLKLLQGPRFSILLEQMVEAFDYVFIDTPPNACGPDARLIAARAGAALLVGRQGHSRVDSMRRMLSQLNQGPSMLAGVVLNRH